MRMAIIYQNHHRNGAGVGIAEHPVFCVSLNLSAKQGTTEIVNIPSGYLT